MKTARLSVATVREYLLRYCFTPSANSAGINPPGLVGVELETYPYRRQGGTIVPAADPGRIVGILEREAPSQDRSVRKVDPVNKKIFFGNGDSVQIEPGGQTELVTAPVGSLPLLWRHLGDLRGMVETCGGELGIQYDQYAMQPWFDPGELALAIGSQRYREMQSYFTRRSPFGSQMMLESSSLHLNLDLGNTKKLITERVVLANLLVPYSVALFANSPNHGREPVPYRSYRYHVWRQLGRVRGGNAYRERMQPGSTFPDLVQAYLDMLLSAPVITTLKPLRLPEELPTFGAWLREGIDGHYPTVEDLRQQLTLLFPDVRIRGFLEIRSLDVPPRGWEPAPIAFYCALLYDDRARAAALSLLSSVNDFREDHLVECVFGLRSDRLYGIARQLSELALAGYGRLPEAFRFGKSVANGLEAYFREYTLRRKTFADDFSP